ncbi:hypothetical protein GCM10027190_13760 [Spirosoma areae]
MTICPPVITNGKLHGVLPVVNQKVTYSEVVDCGSVSQADLFRRTRLWVTQSCTSANDTFTLSDKETGDLVGRVSQVVTLPRSESSAGGVYMVRYSFVIECTNRKYRATITQIDLEDGSARPTPIEAYCQKNDKDLQAIYAELDQQLKGKLASLQDSVKNYKPF